MTEEEANPILRGIEGAKYWGLLPPIGALTGSFFAFQEQTIPGYLVGTVFLLYSVMWLFVNGSSAILIVVRNWNATKAELKRGRDD